MPAAPFAGPSRAPCADSLVGTVGVGCLRAQRELWGPAQLGRGRAARSSGACDVGALGAKRMHGEGGTWVAATPATHDNMLGVQPRASPALEPAGGLQDVGTDLMAPYTLPQGVLAGPLPLPQL